MRRWTGAEAGKGRQAPQSNSAEMDFSRLGREACLPAGRRNIFPEDSAASGSPKKFKIDFLGTNAFALGGCFCFLRPAMI
ncbi:MAG: hypothetical protein HY433_02825 [Candidatus Liptonbacteria bacterium]|nr:hypothetical protein [Candidatus Liptonbacteria bacterium]